MEDIIHFSISHWTQLKIVWPVVFSSQLIDETHNLHLQHSLISDHSMRVGDLGLNKKLRWLEKGGVSLYQGPTWEERRGRFSLFKSLPRLYSWSTCSSGIKSQKHLPQYLTAFPLMKHPPQPESSRWQTWTSLGSWRYCKPSPIPPILNL